MARYESPIMEVITPFSPGYNDLVGESEMASWTPMIAGRSLAPILLALIAMFGLIVFRPRITAGDGGYVESSEVVSPGIVISTSEAEGYTPDSAEMMPAKLESLQRSSSLSPVFTPEVQHWAPQISKWSATYGVDPNIIATIMQIESCGDPSAQSHAGAQGLFQVMPFHFTESEAMLDPDTNAMRGLNFFKEQMHFTKGNIYLSFAGYNGGYAASGGSYVNWAHETQRYYYWAKGIYDEVSSGADSSPTLEQWLAAGGAAGCQRAATRLGL